MDNSGFWITPTRDRAIRREGLRKTIKSLVRTPGVKGDIGRREVWNTKTADIIIFILFLN
jgi:hypothetical protein